MNPFDPVDLAQIQEQYVVGLLENSVLLVDIRWTCRFTDAVTPTILTPVLMFPIREPGEEG